MIETADIYVCPNDKPLRRVTIRSDNGVLIYHAREADCTLCALKAQCTRAGYRALSVNAYEEARQQVAALSKSDEFKKS
jgi:hypothetical protein